MTRSGTLCIVENGEQFAQLNVGRLNHFSQGGMRGVDFGFSRIVERGISNLILRIPMSHMGVYVFPETYHSGSNFERQKHSLPATDFVKRHIVKSLQGGIQRRAESAIPGIAKLARVSVRTLTAQDAYLSSQPQNDGSAPFLRASLVEPIQPKSIFTRTVSLICANKVRRYDGHNRSDCLHPASGVCTGLQGKAVNSGSEQDCQNAYSHKKAQDAHRHTDRDHAGTAFHFSSPIGLVPRHISAAVEAA